MCVICESTLNSSCASEKEACTLMSQMCFSVDVCLCVAVVSNECNAAAL